MTDAEKIKILEDADISWGIRYKALADQASLLVQTLEAMKLTITNTIQAVKDSHYEDKG